MDLASFASTIRTSDLKTNLTKSQSQEPRDSKNYSQTNANSLSRSFRYIYSLLKFLPLSFLQRYRGVFLLPLRRSGAWLRRIVMPERSQHCRSLLVLVALPYLHHKITEAYLLLTEEGDPQPLPPQQTQQGRLVRIKVIIPSPHGGRGPAAPSSAADTARSSLTH